MIRDYMRKDLANFKPYHAALKAYDIKIDANENPYEHSPVVLEKAKNWLLDKDNLTRYPDTDVHELRDKLAAFHGVTKEEIICTVGSDQLIELLIKVFVEPGEVVLVPNPSFTMYTLSTVLNHGRAVPYELNDDFEYDYDKILEAHKIYQPKLVFICTPNNPTGCKASTEGIKKVLETVKCPVIIDEAYEEFIDESMVSFIEAYPNLMVLRTFSKAYGLAGLRIGYGISNDEMIDIVSIAKPPYNVSSFSQAVASYILDEADYYKTLAKDIKVDRDELIAQLRTMALFEKVYDSVANFILVKTPEEGLLDYLQNNKVLVRGYAKIGRLANHIRITVGTKEENRQLLTLLKSYKA